MSEQAQAAVLALGCDHAGLPLLEELRTLLAGRGVEVEDLGVHDSTSVDYPDVAHALAEAVASGRCYRGVLVCGTGVGVSIAANRHPGVRAVVCSEPLSARMARAHNPFGDGRASGRILELLAA